MKLFSALAILLALATASPVDMAPRNATALQKRDTEIVYLADCEHIVTCCPVNHITPFSPIIYYPASAQSHNGVPPLAQNRCTVTPSSWVSWHTASRSCTFQQTGVTFTSHLESNAPSRPLYTWAGWGTNGKTFNCYRDNGRRLFTTGGGGQGSWCDSKYYCIPQ